MTFGEEEFRQTSVSHRHCRRNSSLIFNIFLLLLLTVGPAVDTKAECDVQLVWLAHAATRSPGGAHHRQHHGPAGEDHDQQGGQSTGEGKLHLFISLSKARTRSSETSMFYIFFSNIKYSQLGRESILWSGLCPVPGFDQDVVPTVHLQTAPADHHVQVEQSEGLRGGRSATGVTKGTRKPRSLVVWIYFYLFLVYRTRSCCVINVPPTPNPLPSSPGRWLLYQATLAAVWTSAVEPQRSVNTLQLHRLQPAWWGWVMWWRHSMRCFPPPTSQLSSRKSLYQGWNTAIKIERNKGDVCLQVCLGSGAAVPQGRHRRVP